MQQINIYKHILIGDNTEMLTDVKQTTEVQTLTNVNSELQKPIPPLLKSISKTFIADWKPCGNLI